MSNPKKQTLRKQNDLYLQYPSIWRVNLADSFWGSAILGSDHQRNTRQNYHGRATLEIEKPQFFVGAEREGLKVKGTRLSGYATK